MTTTATRFIKITDLPVRGRYLEAVAERVIIFDGSMGATIEDMDLPVEAYGGPTTAG